VLVASSAQRLTLYMSMYGLTTSRVYAAALTVALVLAVAWCGATVMRGWRQPFAGGMLALGAVTVLALHLLNPERLVVGVNASRAAAGAEFDVVYHASLSADALPALREAARGLAPDQCSALATQLHATWEKRFAEDRKQERGGWNVPRARAARVLDAPVAQAVTSLCGGGPARP
jgi:hypothetical protein